jgi:hypothetical protein
MGPAHGDEFNIPFFPVAFFPFRIPSSDRVLLLFGERPITFVSLLSGWWEDGLGAEGNYCCELWVNYKAAPLDNITLNCGVHVCFAFIEFFFGSAASTCASQEPGS